MSERGRPVFLARETYRQLREVEEVWGEPNFHLRYGQRVTELSSFAEIRDATDHSFAENAYYR